jgi:dienelactone hydrolase/putative intracellular protease/amidase
MPKILTVLTSHDRLGDTGRTTGFYLSEAAYPWQVFTTAGYQVDLVSPRGGRPPVDGADPSDPVQQAFVGDPEMSAKLAATLRPQEVRAADYDAVFYAGGHGTMWDLPGDTELATIARDIYESGGVVGAVCHGPSGLLNVILRDGAHLVDGKDVAAFTNDEETAVGLTEVVPFLLATALTERGARHSGGPDFAPHVVTDERLVTGQNPASATGVAEAMVTALTSHQAPRGEMIRLGDGEGADAYLAVPAEPVGSVIVAGEMFGLNDHVRNICDRFARAGYVALAPDFYWRQERLAAPLYDPPGRERGFELMKGLRREEVIADVADARKALSSYPGGTSITGFSLGGHIAMLSATAFPFEVAAVVYGGWMIDGGIPLAEPSPPLADAAAIAANGTFVLGTVGADDHLFGADEWRRIEERLSAAGVAHDLVGYPGVSHGYFCDARPENYVAAAATDTWRRILNALSTRRA